MSDGKKDPARKPNVVSPSAWLTERPIGDALRENYEKTLNEPLPPRLKALIDQLREEEEKKKKTEKPEE